MKQIQIAQVGLGRLGKSYAEKLNDEIKQAKIVSVCSIIEEERKYAEQFLPAEEIYKDYAEMLKKTKADTLFLITSTNMHVEQIIMALEADKHVFCEKPLALSVSDCEKVLRVAKNFPHLTLMIGFVRRFDRHYRFAKKKVEQGAIGKIYRIDSHTADLEEFVEFQLKFGKSGGSLFLDYNVHDIDLVHWFTGKKFISVYSTGSSIAYPDFEKIGSADNTLVLGELENKIVVTIAAGRTCTHGHWTHTTIHGTKGVLKIGEVPMNANVQVMDMHGVRNECHRTFYERFEEAFVTQMRCFLDCVATGKKSPISLEDALENTRIGVAMTDSFKQKKIVRL